MTTTNKEAKDFHKMLDKLKNPINLKPIIKEVI